MLLLLKVMVVMMVMMMMQGGHSPGKPRKVREFQSGQGKWKKSG